MHVATSKAVQPVSQSKPATHEQRNLPIVCVMHEELLACAFHESGDKGLCSRLEQPLKGISCQGHVACPSNEGYLEHQLHVQNRIWQKYSIQ